MISGGVVPGGSCLRIVCETAVTWATPASARDPWLEEHLDDSNAVVRGGLDVLDIIHRRRQRPFVGINHALFNVACGQAAVYCQTTLTTGMLMDGKMSVGVRSRTKGVSSSSNMRRYDESVGPTQGQTDDPHIISSVPRASPAGRMVRTAWAGLHTFILPIAFDLLRLGGPVRV